jgi:hypothetical protein
MPALPGQPLVDAAARVAGDEEQIGPQGSSPEGAGEAQDRQAGSAQARHESRHGVT